MSVMFLFQTDATSAARVERTLESVAKILKSAGSNKVRLLNNIRSQRFFSMHLAQPKYWSHTVWSKWNTADGIGVCAWNTMFWNIYRAGDHHYKISSKRYVQLSLINCIPVPLLGAPVVKCSDDCICWPVYTCTSTVSVDLYISVLGAPGGQVSWRLYHGCLQQPQAEHRPHLLHIQRPRHRPRPHQVSHFSFHRQECSTTYTRVINRESVASSGLK